MLLLTSYSLEQLLHDGTKEFAQNETDPAKYTLSSENMVQVVTLVDYQSHKYAASHLTLLWLCYLSGHWGETF